MARAGQVAPAVDERLPDRIGIGVLTWVFPREVVDAVVAQAGRTEKRSRSLPSRVVVYFALAMWLYASYGYEEVMRQLVGSLARKHSWARTWTVPSTAALTKARQRVGPEPLRLLFEQVARPVAASGAAGCFYRSWRVVAIDGTVLDVPDTAVNRRHFGAPGNDLGPGAFPQVRLVALAETGTHALIAAAHGPLALGEQALARQVLPELQAGMLVVADRNFPSYALVKQAAATGADLLWRVNANWKLPVLEAFADGSYRSRLLPPGGSAAARTRDAIEVRVIEYTLSGEGHHPNRPSAEVYRLITTIRDPEQAPAADLALLYRQRWEVETMIGELKVHQGQARTVLRSQSVAMVEQELWAMLALHCAIRELICTAADDEDLDADRASFTRALHMIRRSVPEQAAFSP
jgi:hypothetical protein